MEQIIIQHDEKHEYIHQNLGITDERADELSNQIKKEVLSDAVDNGIVVVNEEEESVSLSAARVMDHLINKIAKTTQEQLFLMMHVESLTRLLDHQIQQFGGHSDDSAEEN